MRFLIGLIFGAALGYGLARFIALQAQEQRSAVLTPAS